jgi:hypothetical protein
MVLTPPWCWTELTYNHSTADSLLQASYHKISTATYLVSVKEPTAAHVCGCEKGEIRDST